MVTSRASQSRPWPGLGPGGKDRKGFTGLAGTLEPTGEPEQMLLGLKEEAFQK